MVAAAALLSEAQEAGQDFVVLFGDAVDCSKLIYRALLVGIDVGDEDTHFTVLAVRPLPAGHSPQELVLDSTGEPIAPNFIRPYAICRRPAFLR